MSGLSHRNSSFLADNVQSHSAVVGRVGPLSQGSVADKTVSQEDEMVDQSQSNSWSQHSSSIPDFTATIATITAGSVHRTPSVASQSTACKNVLAVPIIVSCIQCDASTIADPLYNPRLREFVNDEELLGALATIGVHFDQHLDLLLRMKRSTLEMFFVEHIPASKMDVHVKWRLLCLFIKRTMSADAAASLASLVNSMEVDTNPDGYTFMGDDEKYEDLIHIPPPTFKDEVAIINYAYFDFRVSLQYAMELDDDDDDALFGSLLVHIWFLFMHKTRLTSYG